MRAQVLCFRYTIGSARYRSLVIIMCRFEGRQWLLTMRAQVVRFRCAIGSARYRSLISIVGAGH